MNDESIVELAEELLGGLKSPTPSEGGKLVDQGNPNGTSRERETAVYNTPTHESTRFSEQGQSEEFQCESRSSGSFTDIKRVTSRAGLIPLPSSDVSRCSQSNYKT